MYWIFPDYTSGDYFYFNKMTDNPESHHIDYTLIQRDNIYVTSPLNITEETFVSFPKLSVKKMLEPWMDSNIQIVSQL